METLCKICGGKHLTGACTVTEHVYDPDEPPIQVKVSEDESTRDEVPTKPKFPEQEKMQKEAFERNHHAVFRKKTIEDTLNNNEFRLDLFTKEVGSWNEHEEKTKGFNGPYVQLESTFCKNGKLKVYYFPETGAIKFGYTLSAGEQEKLVEA